MKKRPCSRITENDPIPHSGRALGVGYPITTPHSQDPLAGVGHVQLQPVVEDGETPTEVVAGVEEM